MPRKSRTATGHSTEEPRVGALARAGFVRVPDNAARRYIDPRGREVSYREAFRRATGTTLERASRTGKFRNTTTAVLKEIRDAAREGRLSTARLVDAAAERRLARRSVKSLMRGHTFKSATARGVSTAATEGVSSVERRSLVGRLLAVLHAGESGAGFRRKKGETREAYRIRTIGFTNERRFLKERNPSKYRRLFGPTSPKARLLVAMGRREANATYDVGETP